MYAINLIKKIDVFALIMSVFISWFLGSAFTNNWFMLFPILYIFFFYSNKSIKEFQKDVGANKDLTEWKNGKSIFVDHSDIFKAESRRDFKKWLNKP